MPTFAQDEGQGCPATGTQQCLELSREDQTTTVLQTATDAEGGIFGNRNFTPEDVCAVLEENRSEDRTLTTFYAPVPKMIETRVGDTLITAPIVLRNQPTGNQDAATLEIFGGTLAWNDDTFCPENIERSEAAEVTLTEGRTTVKGVYLFYENASGDGEMTGSDTAQVTLEREAEGDSPALSAMADTLSFNSDADERTFTGNVVITAEDRVSEAETLLYNDATGIAVLRGSPATSRRGAEFVQGSVITYYLDSNDVVVVGAVNAAFEVELGDAGLPATPDETGSDELDDEPDEPENPLE